MRFNKNDEKFMRLALDLAQKVKGKVSPDPAVGSVIVKNNRIISTGFHDKFASPHAEEYAIKKAGKRAKNATLYINLEPCCHFGNNPPCTDNIIHAGIKRVVCAMHDPNPLVCTKGFEELKKAGIKVEVGLLKKEAEKLNEFFIKHITTAKPFIILKYAMTLDGKIATQKGESKWISNSKSREYVHKLRSIVDAVMVGIGTVIKDDPCLTVRGIKNNAKNPKRIILDTHLKISLNSNVLKDGASNTIIATSRSADEKKIKTLKDMGVSILKIKAKNGSIDLRYLINKLGKMKITSIMIEGGQKLLTSAIESNIADKIICFVSPIIIGGACAPSPIAGKGVEIIDKAIKLKDVTISQFENNLMIEGYIKGEKNEAA